MNNERAPFCKILPFSSSWNIYKYKHLRGNSDEINNEWGLHGEDSLTHYFAEKLTTSESFLGHKGALRIVTELAFVSLESRIDGIKKSSKYQAESASADRFLKFKK